MRRFDIPAAPPLAGGRGDLLRLVDPRGLAVAWLDLRAGRMVGYATRPAGVTVGGWRELLGGSGERDGAAGGAPGSGALAVGWPWDGAIIPEWPVRWRLSERDPTAATLICRCERAGDPPLNADLALAVSLDDGALCLRLVARAEAGSHDLHARFRLTAPQARIDRRASDGSIAPIDQPETLVLQRAEAAWRLLLTPGPGCAVTLATACDGTGVILTLSSTPQHTDAAHESICALTMTIMPLE